MSETLKEELERLRQSIQMFRERETELSRKLGEESLTHIAAAHRDEDDRATLYDRMTSAELMSLYETNRSEWQRVIEAKHAQGMHRLFGRR